MSVWNDFKQGCSDGVQAVSDYTVDQYDSACDGVQYASDKVVAGYDATCEGIQKASDEVVKTYDNTLDAIKKSPKAYYMWTISLMAKSVVDSHIEKASDTFKTVIDRSVSNGMMQLDNLHDEMKSLIKGDWADKVDKSFTKSKEYFNQAKEIAMDNHDSSYLLPIEQL